MRGECEYLLPGAMSECLSATTLAVSARMYLGDWVRYFCCEEHQELLRDDLGAFADRTRVYDTSVVGDRESAEFEADAA